MKPHKNYHSDLIQDLKDPKETIAYLNAALEDGDREGFLLALRNVVEAQGGMTRFARAARLHRVSLYKMLSKQGNPGIDSVMALLKALGAKLHIEKENKWRRAA